ncbi:hypothetical protein MC885_018688 [Smutsia gigantea]|nr:hypothetical protein MC885_018688 [Smutsia gigantea]
MWMAACLLAWLCVPMLHQQGLRGSRRRLGGRKPSTWTLPTWNKPCCSCRGAGSPQESPVGEDAAHGTGGPSMGTTESRLFGVPLDAMLKTDCKALPSTQVPLVLQALTAVLLEKRGLDTEGIPGGLDRGLGSRSIRELPAPRLTAECLLAFTVVPSECAPALYAVLEFLKKVVAQEPSNKMTVCSVSMVMAPNLFPHRGQSPKLSKGKENSWQRGKDGTLPGPALDAERCGP